MLNEFSRTQLLLGKDAMEKIKNCKVAVFGIGGVGSYTVEALARCNIGFLSLFDMDTVSITNINRQIVATHKTIGQKKVEVAKNRILEINPNCKVEVFDCFYGIENADNFDFSKYSYIVDAIDTVSSKILLVERAKAANVPIISSMGTGNKLDPTRFEVSDIYKTSVCPLAKVMRRELKKRNIKSLKVVYSKEDVINPFDAERLNFNNDTLGEDLNNKRKKQVPASISFVPSVAGLIIAGEVIKDLIK